MATIKTVEGIHPSNSGNTRVMISFTNAADMHFYMKPDGSLHFPSAHNEFTLVDPLDGYREYQWVEKTWKKTNPAVVTEELTGNKRVKAVSLCIKLLNPKEAKHVIAQALIEKSSKGKLGEQLGKGVFKKIRNNISNESKSTPKQAEKPVQQTQATVLPITTTITQPATKTACDSPQIVRYHKRLQKKAR